MNTDEFTIEILPDGTIKVSTDSISPANHLSADRFLKMMEELAGGETKVEKKQGVAHTHHTHTQTVHH